jgi:hypothetical protein
MALSYNASAVKIYNDTRSLVRYESKYFVLLWKNNNAGVVVKS